MSLEIMVKCKNELLLKMGTPLSLSFHNVVGHKHGKCEHTPSTAIFRIMNDYVLFLILQKLTIPRVCNSSMIMFYHIRYLYFSSVSFFEEMVSLVPVNMCRIRNRTILFIIQNWQYWGLVQWIYLAVMKGLNHTVIFDILYLDCRRSLVSIFRMLLGTIVGVPHFCT